MNANCKYLCVFFNLIFDKITLTCDLNQRFVLSFCFLNHMVGKQDVQKARSLDHVINKSKIENNLFIIQNFKFKI